MKKLLVSSIVTVSSLFAMVVYAQTSTTNPAMNNVSHHNVMQHQGQIGIQNMLSHLNLTNYQQNQMRVIMQNNQFNHTQRHNAILQVLTPGQRTKMAQIRSEHRQRGDHMMHQGQSGQMMNYNNMTNPALNGQINQGGRLDLSQ